MCPSPPPFPPTRPPSSPATSGGRPAGWPTAPFQLLKHRGCLHPPRGAALPQCSALLLSGLPTWQRKSRGASALLFVSSTYHSYQLLLHSGRRILGIKTAVLGLKRSGTHKDRRQKLPPLNREGNFSLLLKLSASYSREDVPRKGQQTLQIMQRGLSAPSSKVQIR